MSQAATAPDAVPLGARLRVLPHPSRRPVRGSQERRLATQRLPRLHRRADRRDGRDPARDGIRDGLRPASGARHRRRRDRRA